MIEWQLTVRISGEFAVVNVGHIEFSSSSLLSVDYSRREEKGGHVPNRDEKCAETLNSGPAEAIAERLQRPLSSVFTLCSIIPMLLTPLDLFGGPEYRC
jgi:hypothetical protein